MTGTMEVKAQPVSAAELGVRLFKAPPEGFDPQQANERELLPHVHQLVRQRRDQHRRYDHRLGRG